MTDARLLARYFAALSKRAMVTASILMGTGFVFAFIARAAYITDIRCQAQSGKICYSLNHRLLLINGRQPTHSNPAADRNSRAAGRSGQKARVHAIRRHPLLCGDVAAPF
jgi:hypothetical protein